MPPRTRRRLLRGLGWVGVSLSLLLAGVWVGSMRSDVWYDFEVFTNFGVANGGVLHIDTRSLDP